MDEAVVRCPFCVLDNEFRPMVPGAEGRYVCASCGHVSAPQNKDFHCQCGRCMSLRACVMAAPPPQFWRKAEQQDAPRTSGRIRSDKGDFGLRRSSKLA